MIDARALGAVLVVVAVVGCGSRSELQLAGAGAGVGGSGAAGSGGAPGGGGSTSAGGSGAAGGGLPGCTSLVVRDVIAPSWLPDGRHPELAHSVGDGDVMLLELRDFGASSPAIIANVMAPFSEWPPDLQGTAKPANAVADYTLGAGPDGPVALLRFEGGDSSFFATTVYSAAKGVSFFTGSDRPLFATAIQDRYFAAQVTETPDYEVLGVGSYQPDSLVQNDGPLYCLSSPVLADAAPSGQGFLAAFAAPGLSKMDCDSQDPSPGTTVSVMRYDSSLEPGSFLERTQGARFNVVEPLVWVRVAPASFGAWVVYQTDGSTSRTPPPVMVVRVDSSGFLLDDGAATPVPPDSQTTTALAVASLGDRLAVATVDNLDPSAPTILVQIVEPDHSLGPAVAIPTNGFWLSGRMDMLGSPDGQELLLVWEADLGIDGQQRSALTRIDCLQGD